MPQRPPTSSSKAAKNVIEKEGRLSNIGFGGFSGSLSVDTTKTSDLLSLAGEYPSIFKQLLKKNAKTKFNALQRLEELLKNEKDETVSILMSQWVVVFRPLSSDADRGVRQKSVEILEIYVKKLKRQFAPFLKSVMGSWWIAQNDTYRPIAKAARSLFDETFQGEKSTEAVMHCRSELASHLIDCLRAQPALTELRTENKEEQIERTEFIIKVGLMGTQCFLDNILNSSKRNAVEESVSLIGSALFTKTLLKKLLTNDSPSVRLESYKLVARFLTLGQKVVSETLSVTAPLIFNSLSDSDPCCQQDMWHLIMHLIKEFPNAWDFIHVEKATIPKLCTILRDTTNFNEQSCRFVLLLASQIPKKHWNSSPQILKRVFLAIWEGLTQTSDASIIKIRLDLLHECILWGLLSVFKLTADESAETFREALIQGTILRISPWCSEHPTSQKDISLLARLLSQCLCTLSNASFKAPENPVPSAAFSQLLKSVMDGFLSARDKEESQTALAELLIEISKADSMCSEGREKILEAMTLPLESLSQQAFSLSPSNPAAKCLRGYSHALNTCLVRFPSQMSPCVGFRIFEAIQKLLEIESDISSLENQIDLLVLSFPQESIQSRELLWKTLLSYCNEQRKTKEETISRFFLQICRSLSLFEFHSMNGIAIEDIHMFCQLYLGTWTSNTISDEICKHFIGLHKTLFSPSVFSDILQQLAHQLRDPELHPEASEPIRWPEALFSKSTVENLTEETEEHWLQLVVTSIECVLDILSCPKSWKQSMTRIWDNGKCMEGMKDVLSSRLSSKLQFLVIGIVQDEKSHFVSEKDSLIDITEGENSDSVPKEDSVDAFRLDRLIETVLQLPGTDSETFLEKLFDEASWCRYRNPSEVPKTSPLNYNCFIRCVEHLIISHGVPLIENLPSGVSLLLEILLCRTASQEGKEALLSYLVDCVLTTDDPTLTRSIRDRLIYTFFEVEDECILEAHFRLIAWLEDHCHEIRVLSFLEATFKIVAENFENAVQGFPLSEIASNRKLKAVHEGFPYFVADTVKVLRKTSLISVRNAKLDETTNRWIEKLKNVIKTPNLDRNVLNLYWDTFRSLLPLSDNPFEPFLSTTHEQENLLDLTKLIPFESEQGVRLWETVMVYIPQLDPSHWERLFANIASCTEKVRFCEDLCEQMVEHVRLEKETNTCHDIVLDPKHIVLKMPEGPFQDVPLPIWDWTQSKHIEKDAFCGVADRYLTLFLKGLEIKGDTFTALSQQDANVRKAMRLSLRFIFCVAVSCVIERESRDCTLRLFYHRAIDSWTRLTRLFEIAMEDLSLIEETLEGIDLWQETTGIDSATTLIVSSFSKMMYGAHLGSIAIRLLVFDRCISKLIQDEKPNLPDQEAFLEIKDPVELIKFSGVVHEDLARSFVGTSDEKMLLSGALILASLETKDKSIQQHFSEVFRSLTPYTKVLLESLSELLPLPPSPQKFKPGLLLSEKRKLEESVMQKESFSLRDLLRTIGIPKRDEEWQVLAMKMYHIMVSCMAVNVRIWFNDLTSTYQSNRVELYTMTCESPSLIEAEFDRASCLGFGSDFSIHYNPQLNTITSKYKISESTFRLVLTIPECLPLKPVTVHGVSEALFEPSRFKTWSRWCRSQLANNQGSVIDVIEIWKKTLDNTGIDSQCIICFDVIIKASHKDGCKECNTCHVKFHSSCLYTWFRQSSKALCPHCQMAWSSEI